MKDKAYIIIHGFGGLPTDVDSIKEQLILKNVEKEDIYTPTLLGHGNQGRIKLGTKYEDIAKELEKYIKENCANYKKNVVIGFSMGALISMALAINLKIDTLILLNAPMHIWVFRNFIWTVGHHRNKFYHFKTVLSSFTYNKIMSSFELRRLQIYVNNNLDKITADTYILQSKHDYVAKPNSANEIYDKIGAKVKVIRWDDFSTHFVPDEDSVEDFIKDVLYWLEEKK